MELLKQDIQRFNFNDEIISKLYDNNIKTINNLCKQSKTDLKNIELKQSDIYKIEVELQLVGLNLKNKG